MDITFVFYLVNMKNSMAMKCVSLVVCFVLTSYVTGASVEEGTICKGIDVRNVVESFSQLENCTVIEGSLSILLIEGATQEKYQALSFPNLREITDYLLLYRVYGLKTLSNIFPNLSVIRGQKLFYNFALVAFEMMDLEELGLIGLTVIERGAVRLEKNHQLCYIDTIDWTRIAIGVDRKDHYIHGNKIPSECIDICSKQCQSTPKSDFENNKMIPRCWTLQYCQLNLDCPASQSKPSGFCNKMTKEPCHPNCLGGCKGPTHLDCDACRDVIYTDEDGVSQCRKFCLPGTYMYKKRRCLLEDECQAYEMKLFKDPDKGDDAGQCVDSCPAGYTKDTNDTYKCIKCKDTCPKECFHQKVDSVSAAQELSGCTIIKGPLEIRIVRGSNIQQELEKNLGQITEIKDYLWIHNSHSLLSLNFFKSLKTIGGISGANGYSLLVNDNENLQTLFTDEVERNLEITKGNLSFHYNRKLCLQVIQKFESKVKMDPRAKNDISNTTNGDQASCSISTLNLTVFQVTSHVAFLRWDKYRIGDPRALVSYVISYKVAPFQNVSIFEGRDACSNDVWKTRDMLSSTKKESDYITSLLLQLRPWTQYAVYVRTYTTSNARYGARSKLIYFRTAASMPTVPSNLKVKAIKPGELHVTWEPPNQPNGNVTHYEVYWTLRDFDSRTYAPRDYCNNPLVPYDPKKVEEEEEKRKEEEKKKEIEKEGRCCTCEASELDLAKQARERDMQIMFENFLHNSVYLKRDPYRPDRVKRPPSTKNPDNGTKSASEKRRKRNLFPEVVDPREFEKYRQKRQISSTVMYNTSLTNVNEMVNVNVTDEVKDNPKIRKNKTSLGHTPLKAVVYAREIIIPNLGHFEDYTIEVIACQERDPRDPDKVKYCSSRALTVGRTLKSDTADDLNPATITAEPQQNKTGFVMIKWKDPPNPNGPIIKYMIEYDKGGLSTQNQNLICRTYQDYRKLNGTIIPNLSPGNYSYRIRAFSLAGSGAWSEIKSFYISAKQDEPWSSTTIIAVSVSLVILVIVIAVIIVWFIARNRMTKIPENFLSVTVNPDYMPDHDAYIPDEWEVDRDKISLLRELGQGSFGMVWEGKAKDLIDKGKEILVAVKTVNENADYYQKVAFLKEASIMKGFKCHHVVQLLGIVSQSQPALVVMELMTNGDLKNYLRLRRPGNEDGLFPPTLKQIWQMAGEIADGMAYLSDKKFVHRDLAARNCMVAGDLTVKIGDFGMTRDVYETDYYRKGGKGLLPVRWMGPESLKDGVFTSYSDVWSYGVVLWEMVTLAELPYIGLSHEQVIKYVTSGKVIEKPEGCPERLYSLMLQCWRFKDKQRPTFQQIIEILVPELDPSFMEKSYFFSEDNHLDDYHEGEEDFIDDEDLLDDSHKPFIAGGEGDSSHHGSHHSHSQLSSHGYEEQDEELKFVDFNHHDRYGTEPCDCIMLEETDHRNRNHVDSSYRDSSCSNPNSAIDTSNGSKDSSTSKSSNSSYPMNGINLNIVNGHVPVHMRSTPC